MVDYSCCDHYNHMLVTPRQAFENRECVNLARYSRKIFIQGLDHNLDTRGITWMNNAIIQPLYQVRICHRQIIYTIRHFRILIRF